jgi:hypothetical protein
MPLEDPVTDAQSKSSAHHVVLNASASKQSMLEINLGISASANHHAN